MFSSVSISSYVCAYLVYHRFCCYSTFSPWTVVRQVLHFHCMHCEYMCAFECIAQCSVRSFRLIHLFCNFSIFIFFSLLVHFLWHIFFVLTCLTNSFCSVNTSTHLSFHPSLCNFGHFLFHHIICFVVHIWLNFDGNKKRPVICVIHYVGWIVPNMSSL